MALCPQCGYEGSVRFCPSCGRPMAQRCPQCGALCEAQARFCGDCGARFEVAPGTGSWETGGARSIGDIGMVRGNVDQSTHTSTQIGTNISGSIGSLNIVQQPQTPTAEELVHRGRRALEAHLYPAAQGALQQAAALADNADTHYYLALACLAGRRPKLLSLPAIRGIEEHLSSALRLDDACQHARALWAVVKQDFYVMNGMFDRPPTVAQLISQCGHLSGEHVREILGQIEAPGNAVLDWLRQG